MKFTLRNVSIGAAALLTALGISGGLAYAISNAASPAAAQCTSSPEVTYSDSSATFTQTCVVPVPPAETVTVTETATATATATATDTATSSTTTVPTTSTSSTTTTATETSSSTTTTTTATTPPDPGNKPTDANTGVPAGTQLKPYTGNMSVNVSNVTFDGYDFPSMFKVTGSNVTIKNSRLRGLAFYGPGPFLLQDSTGSGVVAIDGYYRDISGVVIDGYRGVMGSHDGIDVFAQPNGKITDVTIKNSFLDGQNFPSTSTAHGDGIQVRGVHGLKVLNTVVDLGPNQPQKNAALYLELAGYGLDDILVRDVWLDGGGYTFYSNPVTNSLAQRVRLGPTHRYSEFERTRGKGWVFDDVTDASGKQLTAP